MSQSSALTRLVSPIVLLDQAIERLSEQDFTPGEWHLGLAGQRIPNNARLSCRENDFRLDYALDRDDFFYLPGNVRVEKVNVTGDYHAHREPDHTAVELEDHPFVALAEHIHDFASSETSPNLGAFHSIVDLMLTPNLEALQDAHRGRNIGALSVVGLTFDAVAYHVPHVPGEAIDSLEAGREHNLRKEFLEGLCEDNISRIVERLNRKERGLYELERLLDPQHPWLTGVTQCKVVFRLFFEAS